MYLIETFFKYQNDSTLSVEQISALLNQVVEQWRYNGQIIGREIPLFFAEQEGEDGVAIRVICPEQQSLLPDFNNTEVNIALKKAESAGIFFDSFQVVADDLNSDTSAPSANPLWQVLYTTYLQSCSPLHSGDNLMPIPLYRQFQWIPHLSQDIIKWQENWQACDQLQMNGTVLEQQALHEISDVRGNLFKHGYSLRKEIELHTGIPTYYYLYRIGGECLEQEEHRKCPLCHKDWRLETALFDIFYFKCDCCRLVSNLSWNWC